MYSAYSFKQIKKVPLKTYLSDREIIDYKEIPEAKKKGWLAARFCAKKEACYLLMQNYKKKVLLREVEITRKRFQKPVCKLPFKTNRTLNISLSHCGELAVASVADNKAEGLVGCDIEKIRDFKYNILKSFLTPKEIKVLKKAKLSEKPVLATLLWSVKEAYLKAKGVGLVYHPKFIELDINPKGNFCGLRDKDKEVPAEIGWSIYKNKYIFSKVNILKYSYGRRFREKSN